MKYFSLIAAIIFGLIFYIFTISKASIEECQYKPKTMTLLGYKSSASSEIYFLDLDSNEVHTIKSGPWVIPTVPIGTKIELQTCSVKGESKVMFPSMDSYLRSNDTGTKRWELMKEYENLIRYN